MCILNKETAFSCIEYFRSFLRAEYQLDQLCLQVEYAAKQYMWFSHLICISIEISNYRKNKDKINIKISYFVWNSGENENQRKKKFNSLFIKKLMINVKKTIFNILVIIKWFILAKLGRFPGKMVKRPVKFDNFSQCQKCQVAIVSM